MVGTGLAGASAAASLGESRIQCEAFCFRIARRRAHSIAAWGRYQRSKKLSKRWRQRLSVVLRYDKGGDYRAREANVHRLAEVSVNIIDQCVAQGVPLPGSMAEHWPTVLSAGPSIKNLYARGQTGQQLLLGAYSAFNRQIANGKVKMYNRTEMLGWLWWMAKARHHHPRFGDRKNWIAQCACSFVVYRWIRKRVLPFNKCKR